MPGGNHWWESAQKSDFDISWYNIWVKSSRWVFCSPYPWSVSRPVVFNSMRPCELYPAGLLCPWNFPGENIGVGCHFILQGISLTHGSNPGPMLVEFFIVTNHNNLMCRLKPVIFIFLLNFFFITPKTFCIGV